MIAAESRAEETFLGFDFGTRRIGVAVASRRLGDARPLTTLVTHAQPDWGAIAGLIAEWQPTALVVGRPLTMDGSPQPATRAADRFIAELKRRFGLPVHAADERMSTMDAEARLREQRVSGERRRRVRTEDIDATAAKLILEHWLRQPA